MPLQRRWFCRACTRQWVLDVRATGADAPCPACGSADVTRVTYDAPFPGGDFDPVSHAPAPVAASAPPVAQAPPLVLIGSSSEAPL